jgi:hypothetical protein
MRTPCLEPEIFKVNESFKPQACGLCTDKVPLRSVTDTLRAGKKFPLMQEFGDFFARLKWMFWL